MKLVLISDTHSLHDQVEVPDGDVLIHAGDFMNHGTRFHELESFVKWWNNQPHSIKILVAGNHDILVEERPDLLKNMLVGTDYLLDSGCEYFGIKLWGSPYTPTFFNWAFMRDRGEAIKKHWDLIPEDTNVLITHGPPLYYLDSSKNWGPALGCRDLADAVHRIHPKLHVFGHIHGGYGQTDNGSTKFVNAAQLSEAYKVVNKPIVVEV